MIILIHGDDMAESRRLLTLERQRYADAEIVSFDGKSVTYNDFLLASETQTLLAKSKVIVMERLLSKAQLSEKKEILAYINSQRCQMDVIVWEDKEIEKNTIRKYFSEARVQFAALPQKLFSFLDSIGTVSKSQIIASFHALLGSEEAEFLYVMMLRQWRYLIIAQDKEAAASCGMAPWQLSKLSRQSRLFTPSQLVSSYRQLLSIDYKIKSGLTPYDTARLLDIFLLTL